MGEAAPTENLDIQEINCLFVPLHETSLLIPMSAVAEVVQAISVTEQQDAPEWFDGWLEWRQKRVPLISFEALSNGHGMEVTQGSSALVMNTLNPEKGLSYYALHTQDFSHLVRVMEDYPMEEIDTPDGLSHILMSIELDGQTMQIPNLESLEDFLATQLQSLVKQTP